MHPLLHPCEAGAGQGGSSANALRQPPGLWARHKDPSGGPAGWTGGPGQCKAQTPVASQGGERYQWGTPGPAGRQQCPATLGVAYHKGNSSAAPRNDPVGREAGMKEATLSAKTRGIKLFIHKTRSALGEQGQNVSPRSRRVCSKQRKENV